MLIIGNWKMNGTRLTNENFANAWQGIEADPAITLSIACPSVYLQTLNLFLKKTPLSLCAQDVSFFSQQGPYTGEVSATMLADIGVKHVLIGHSERRQYFHENNKAITRKIAASKSAGLIPILCVGETQTDRQTGKTNVAIEKQLDVLTKIPHRETSLSTIIIAYEPVWAIGTGQIASPEQISEISQWIRNFILQNLGLAATIKILYGGSVSAKNAESILSTGAVEGLLVGSASLDSKELLYIYSVAKRFIVHANR